LHDRELTPSLAAVLREIHFPASLGLMPATQDNVLAWQIMAQGVANLPDASDPAQVWNDLAAEYASIYLTGAYNASPYESVWTDDDRLICQDAMFELREIYARANLRVIDWRQRPDDHLATQLLYIAHAARRAATQEDWRGLATMLDEHLLRWLPNFAARVAERSSSDFYVGLAVLSAAWVDTLRDLLANTLDEPRPTRTEIEERLMAQRSTPPEPVPLRFMPGAGGPSW